MFEPKLNIDSETKEWIDESIEWVIDNLGYEYLKTKNDVKPWDILRKEKIESDEEFWEIVEFIIKKMDITEQINFFTIDSNQEHIAMINRVGYGQFEENTPGGLYINEENKRGCSR